MKTDIEYEAELIIHLPDDSAKKCAAFISAMPTRMLEKGEYLSKKGEKRTNEGSSIYFESTPSKNEPIEEHIKSLFFFVENHKLEFAKLPVNHQLEIWCTISSKKESGFVGISLDKNIIATASRLGISVVFSVWVTGEL